ncbi:TetR/AcrR family transcriptional regulator [Amycolatopsis antarctica]|uniref:TetR/AcrR family transcriptional regulator n=1 Tax=Amycolatopsis antarctica TaxID=1854586 RepID=UPI00105663C9|nr:TetR/AcrR family transcriptional regulator C-terminal domain-containing protein [Amycolatopsis antarctica]
MTEDAGVSPLDSVWLSAAGAAESRPGRPSGLNRGQIVRTAIGMLDRDGLGALSIRRLAAELSVAPMSLYWHVPTKDALLEFALDEVFTEVDPAAEDLPWQDAVRAVARGIRTAIHAHPWVPGLLGSLMNSGPVSMRLTDSLIGALERSEMPRAEIGLAVGTINNFVYAYAGNEVKWMQRISAQGVRPEEIHGEMMRRFTDRYAGELPRIVHYVTRVELGQPGEHFEYGLGKLLAGLASPVRP